MRALHSYRPRRLRLRDGRRVTLRAAVEADAAELVQAFERLSPQARYQRYMRSKTAPDLEALQRDVRPVEGEEFTFVATVPAADGIDIVASARLVRSASNAGNVRSICEFAITVGDDWRAVGLGSALLAALIRRARYAGYQSIEGFVLATNAPMLGCARRLGFAVAPLAGEPSIRRVWRDLRRARARPLRRRHARS